MIERLHSEHSLSTVTKVVAFGKRSQGRHRDQCTPGHVVSVGSAAARLVLAGPAREEQRVVIVEVLHHIRALHTADHPLWGPGGQITNTATFRMKHKGLQILYFS